MSSRFPERAGRREHTTSTRAAARRPSGRSKRARRCVHRRHRRAREGRVIASGEHRRCYHAYRGPRCAANPVRSRVRSRARPCARRMAFQPRRSVTGFFGGGHRLRNAASAPRSRARRMGPVMMCGPPIPDSPKGGWTPRLVPSSAVHSRPVPSSLGTSLRVEVDAAPGSRSRSRDPRRRCERSRALKSSASRRRAGRRRCVVVGEREGCSSSDREGVEMRGIRVATGRTREVRVSARGTNESALAARANATRRQQSERPHPRAATFDCAQKTAS